MTACPCYFRLPAGPRRPRTRNQPWAIGPLRHASTCLPSVTPAVPIGPSSAVREHTPCPRLCLPIARTCVWTRPYPAALSRSPLASPRHLGPVGDTADKPAYGFLIVVLIPGCRSCGGIIIHAGMTSAILSRAAPRLLSQLSRAIGRESAHAELRWMQQTLDNPPSGIPPTAKTLEEMVQRRVSGEPLQYILGE